MSKIDLSRRSFLKGMGAAGAVGALAAMSGCGQAPKTVDTAAPQAEGGEISGDWRVAPEAITEAAETLDCEILVVGAGAAGAPAAMYAAEHGADVVVLQKTDQAQTNGWSFGTWNSPLGEENGIVWDIPKTMQTFATKYCNGRVNMKLYRRVLTRSGEAAEYIVKNVPEIGEASILPISDHIVYFWTEGEGLGNRYNSFLHLVRIMTERAEKAGARVLYNTPAIQLIKDDSGTVIGAFGQKEDGTFVRVNASKGVLLATGDVTDDEDMVREFCPIMEGVPSLHTLPCNTGDGHKMGFWAGAEMDKAPFAIMMHYDPSPLYSPAPPFAAVPFLHVNLDGERFMNENIDYQSSATAVSLQKDHIAFQVFDSHFMEHVYNYTNGGRTFPPTSQEAFDGYVEAGSIMKADTLEELAEKSGIDKEGLLATVKRYNELVDGGVDEDFGMASEYFAWNGIKDAPFYSIKRKPAVLAACGGLRCNDELQVLDTDKKPIPGLYAAGNVQGSFFGYDYPVTGYDGFSIGRSMTGGILAVKSIMGTLDEAI